MDTDKRVRDTCGTCGIANRYDSGLGKSLSRVRMFPEDCESDNDASANISED